MSLFERFTASDATDLIREYPLAWLLPPAGATASDAALLPLLAKTDEDGSIAALEGHMPKRHALHAALTASPCTTILFQGPQGYISPSWVHDRTWAPTWNFAQLRFEVEIAFDPAGGDASIAALVEAMEDGRENRWRVEEMGTRYRGLEQRVIAFTGRVRAVAGRFKLGQDERPEILADIMAHVDEPGLARWMRRFNPGRC